MGFSSGPWSGSCDPGSSGPIYRTLWAPCKSDMVPGWPLHHLTWNDPRDHLLKLFFLGGGRGLYCILNFRYNAYIDFLQQVFEGYSSENQIPHVRQEEVMEPMADFASSLSGGTTAKAFLTEQEEEQVFGTGKGTLGCPKKRNFFWIQDVN